MTSVTYAIVEFTDEKLVEIVPELWIESFNGAMFSYWPRFNVVGKVKKAEIPDKRKWQKYKIRILSYTDNYDTALRRAKKAEETSTVESDSDSELGQGIAKRPKKDTPKTRQRPGSYHYAEMSDRWDDSLDDMVVKEKSSGNVLRPMLPPAPSFSSTPLTGRCKPTSSQGFSTESTLISAVNNVFAPMHGDVLSNVCNANGGHYQSPLSLTSSPVTSGSPVTSCQQQYDNILNNTGNARRANSSSTASVANTVVTNDLNSLSNQRQLEDVLNKSNFHEGAVQESVLHTESVSHAESTNGLNSSSSQRQCENFQRCVLTKLDLIIEKQDEGLSMLRMLLGATRGADENDMLEDVIPKAIDSVEELNKFSSRLDDEEFMKKVLHFMIGSCGANCGVSTRKIMAKVGTNNLWSKYSLKGRKSKLSFKELAICRIMIKACLRVHKKVSEVEVEEHIAEYLKHAPSKPGGTRHKERENEKTQGNEERNKM